MAMRSFDGAAADSDRWNTMSGPVALLAVLLMGSLSPGPLTPP
ncbi:hypothetical protein [Nocardia grenadensis]